MNIVAIQLKGIMRKYAGGESVAAQGDAKGAEPWVTVLWHNGWGSNPFSFLWSQIMTTVIIYFTFITFGNLGIDDDVHF
jgi:hypothetical protein